MTGEETKIEDILTAETMDVISAESEEGAAEPAEAKAERRTEDPADFTGAVEAALFALGREVSVSELAKCAGCRESTARKAARTLADDFEIRGSGIRIREFDGCFQMCTAPEYYESLIRVVAIPKKPVLTDVVMETLAIIAYKAPTTKVDVEKIRGVNSDHAVNRLIEYGLVEECGRLEAPGRPILFRPTEEFYRRFGVKDKSEMPNLSPDAQAEIEAQAEKEALEAIPVTT